MNLSQDFRTNEGGSARHDRIGPRIVVIGGGANGVLMVLHLLRRTSTAPVDLVKKTDLLGCDVATAFWAITAIRDIRVQAVWVTETFLDLKQLTA